MFSVSRIYSGVSHITDAMGVSFTLIEGNEKAVLFDTGYGTENVAEYVRMLTDRPVKVLLSHGHHDHVLGARWFGKTYLCKEDMDEFSERTGELQRRKVMQQAEERGILLPADFLYAPIIMPEPIRFTEKTGEFDSTKELLGSLEINVIRVPGHTPGSIVIFIPAYRMLLTGDDWNPCTWMWFPSSLNVRIWRNNMISLIRELEDEYKTEITGIICSHQSMVREGSELKRFLAYMTDERLDRAQAVDMGTEIKTHQVLKEPEGWTLVFDSNKK